MTDTIIIGGGAAGCFAAVNAARFGKTVLLFEKNEKLGRKLRITGKGRCNVTNNSPSDEHMKNIPVNPRFMYSSFEGFDAECTMSFFEELGVPLKTERGNRVFPVSDNANDIADALAREMKKLGVRVINKRVTKILTEDGAVCGVKAGGRGVPFIGSSHCLRRQVLPCNGLHRGRLLPCGGSGTYGYGAEAFAGASHFSR